MEWVANWQWILLGLGGIQMFCMALYVSYFHLGAAMRGAEKAAVTDEDKSILGWLRLVIYAATIAAIVLGPAALIFSLMKLGLI